MPKATTETRQTAPARPHAFLILQGWTLAWGAAWALAWGSWAIAEFDAIDRTVTWTPFFDLYHLYSLNDPAVMSPSSPLLHRLAGGLVAGLMSGLATGRTLGWSAMRFWRTLVTAVTYAAGVAAAGLAASLYIGGSVDLYATFEMFQNAPAVLADFERALWVGLAILAGLLFGARARSGNPSLGWSRILMSAISWGMAASVGALLVAWLADQAVVTTFP